MGKTRATTLPPALDRIRTMMTDARERQADVVYDLETVLDVMRDAAGDGLDTVTIAPDKPLDLRETKTAKTTKAALEAEGFRVEWTPIVAKPGEPSTYVLTVSW